MRPFHFLKYLQPTSYFELKSKAGKSVFPRVEILPPSITTQLEHDEEYHSKVSQDYDLSWQAIQLGYIGSSETQSEC